MTEFQKAWTKLTKGDIESRGEAQSFRDRLKGLSKEEAELTLKNEYGLSKEQAGLIIADNFPVEKSKKCSNCGAMSADSAPWCAECQKAFPEDTIKSMTLTRDAEDKNWLLSCPDCSVSWVVRDEKQAKILSNTHLKSSHAYKDISPYGQSYNAGQIVEADQSTAEYEIKPTHYTNINNMDPGVLDGDYDINPTYAMDNDETTKAKKKDDKVQWITVGGKHVPVKPGQSKNEAVQAAGVGNKKKPGSDKKSERGSWSKDEPDYDYKRMSVKQLEEELEGHEADLDELGEDADGGSEYSDIESVINELRDEIERAKKEKKTKKSIQQELVELESQIFKTETFNQQVRTDLIIKHRELTKQLFNIEKSQKTSELDALNKSIGFMEEVTKYSFKDALNRFNKSLSSTDRSEIVELWDNSFDAEEIVEITGFTLEEVEQVIRMHNR